MKESLKENIQKLHFKSITMRWFVEVFLIVALAVTVIGTVMAIIESNLYIERVEVAAKNYVHEFSALEFTTADSYSEAAVNLCETFPYKDKIEVEIVDKDGVFLASTSGFAPRKEGAPDYQKLFKENRNETFKEKTSTGERVMTGTNVLNDEDGKRLGAVHWLVSLDATYSRINTVIIFIAAVLIAVLALCAVSGVFFIKSIVRPIREVSNTARKIAMGDMKDTIKSDRNDEIGELCEAIDYMATELQHADTLKNDFISSVSHELRTPLTAIRGWGETAKSAVGNDEELVSRGLEVVLGESDRLSNLVEELLDFSRMQQGRLTVTTAPIDVSELLRTVTDMYSELAKKQGIELSYTPPKQNSIVLGDRDRLKQVFINIIDNAVKYTEKGGLVLIVQSREDGCVQIQVKDTGVGIPAKDVAHVKEKFYKANKTVRGSGIGLAVADEIIRQHDGLLIIESTEGVGTTSSVVLPLYEEPEELIEENPQVQQEVINEVIEADNTAEPIPQEESPEEEPEAVPEQENSKTEETAEEENRLE